MHLKTQYTHTGDSMDYTPKKAVHSVLKHIYFLEKKKYIEWWCLPGVCNNHFPMNVPKLKSATFHLHRVNEGDLTPVKVTLLNDLL